MARIERGSADLLLLVVRGGAWNGGQMVFVRHGSRESEPALGTVAACEGGALFKASRRKGQTRLDFLSVSVSVCAFASPIGSLGYRIGPLVTCRTA